MQSLRSRNLAGTVEFIEIDVTSDRSISDAAERVLKDHGRLDSLINNAGTAGLTGLSTRKSMASCIDTNAIGAAVVGEVFAPLLQASSGEPRILNVSSASGSITRRLDASSPSYKMPGILQYRMSKAALNMVSADQWAMLGPTVKVFAWCPGFVVSNFSSMNTLERGAKAANEAVRPAIDILEGRRDEDAGKFLSASDVIPW